MFARTNNKHPGGRMIKRIGRDPVGAGRSGGSGGGGGAPPPGGIVTCAADVETGTTSGGDDGDDAAAKAGKALLPLEGAALMRNVLPAVLVACLGAFSFGYHLGIVNPALEHLALDLGIAANVQMKGLVVSTVLIGATVGSLCSGKVADDLGRKSALIASAAPLVAGSLLCSCASAVWIMLLGRERKKQVVGREVTPLPCQRHARCSSRHPRVFTCAFYSGRSSAVWRYVAAASGCHLPSDRDDTPVVRLERTLALTYQ
jgi:hypothetical protein